MPDICRIASQRLAIRVLKESAAISPESAQTLDSLGIAASTHVQRLFEHGVLVAVDGDRCYLDRSTAARIRRSNMKFMCVTLAAIATFVGLFTMLVVLLR